jgi:diaminohydroxyphosphoribosylaminopyrimidine deaminase/5-amino-6-(5-phosphoribosylamino)uracil reductase
VDDAHFMKQAIAMSETVADRTGDNPAVGCVVVRDGAIVARGATQPPGGAHAEVVAVREAEAAGHPIGECDFYVTLEPCTFQGRTPPCSRLLVEKRPRRVIVGMRDPHPQVRGAGIEELRNAGIEVVEGVLLEEISALLAWWVQRNSCPA